MKPTYYIYFDAHHTVRKAMYTKTPRNAEVRGKK